MLNRLNSYADIKGQGLDKYFFRLEREHPSETSPCKRFICMCPKIPHLLLMSGFTRNILFFQYAFIFFSFFQYSSVSLLLHSFHYCFIYFVIILFILLFFYLFRYYFIYFFIVSLLFHYFHYYLIIFLFTKLATTKFRLFVRIKIE